MKLALLEENQTLMTLQQKTVKRGVDGCLRAINCTITLISSVSMFEPIAYLPAVAYDGGSGGRPSQALERDQIGWKVLNK